MRATNPVLSRLAEAARETLTTSVSGDVMTRAGTAGKSLILLALCAFSATFTWLQVAAGNTAIMMPALLVGGLGGFVMAMIVSFKPNTAPVVAPIYAVLEGLILGAISALFNPLEFAAELLMPKTIFGRCCDGVKRPSMTHVRDLATRFATSLSARCSSSRVNRTRRTMDRKSRCRVRTR